MLGHASIDQTDNYLNANSISLQEHMRKFDGIRCNPVGKEAPKEHPPGYNEVVAGQEQVTVD